jgi:hypothetical protein
MLNKFLKNMGLKGRQIISLPGAPEMLLQRWNNLSQCRATVMGTPCLHVTAGCCVLTGPASFATTLHVLATISPFQVSENNDQSPWYCSFKQETMKGNTALPCPLPQFTFHILSDIVSCNNNNNNKHFLFQIKQRFSENLRGINSNSSFLN